MNLSLSFKFAALAQSLFVLSVLATPNPINGSSNIVVRDPAIWYNSDAKASCCCSKYYVFSTGGNITTFTSSSLTGPWSNVGAALPNCSTINLGTDCTLWAPDVNFQNGQYVMYFASSSVGSQNSAIGVATSASMDPGSWADHGEVISSKTGDAYNAIDANLIDANGLKLSFGSYNDGLFQISLSDVQTPSSSLPGNHVAGSGKRPAEGGFAYKPSGSNFYYFFFSYGVTPLEGATSRPANGTEYRVLVGRSNSVSGPFTDKDGKDLTENVTDPPTGTVVLASHDNVYAPGGQSVFRDPVSGRDVMVYHYVKNDAPVGGPSYLGINYLDFSSGWPVVVN
ncbi:glycoside hydrolase family 43 protein [Peniophora sp. CONT]|nr:glycoside hydrolase family 43 protein [Peniophora sp. CONT]